MNKKYTKEMLNSVVSESTSFRQVLLKLGLKEAGGSYENLKKRCDEFNIDYTHFNGKGWKVYGHVAYGKNAIPLEDFFRVYEVRQRSCIIKKRLLNNRIKEYKCERCGISDWMGEKIIIELHHINGNGADNRLENLQLLCPNCHSQTHTYCKRKELLK
jgi:Zn finger protein HypA/HybF involved in hydrogenase expression